LVTFSKSYARKQKWVFLSEHSAFMTGFGHRFMLYTHALKYTQGHGRLPVATNQMQ